MTPGCTLKRPLFEKSAERRDARAGTNHNDVGRIIFRQAKGARFLNVNRDVLNEHFCMVCEEARGQSLLLAPVCLVANHRNTNLNLTRMRLKGRSDGIKARNNWGELRQKSFR